MNRCSELEGAGETRSRELFSCGANTGVDSGDYAQNLIYFSLLRSRSADSHVSQSTDSSLPQNQSDELSSFPRSQSTDSSLPEYQSAAWNGRERTYLLLMVPTASGRAPSGGSSVTFCESLHTGFGWLPFDVSTTAPESLRTKVAFELIEYDPSKNGLPRSTHVVCKDVFSNLSDPVDKVIVVFYEKKAAYVFMHEPRSIDRFTDLIFDTLCRRCDGEKIWNDESKSPKCPLMAVDKPVTASVFTTSREWAESLEISVGSEQLHLWASFARVQVVIPGTFLGAKGTGGVHVEFLERSEFGVVAQIISTETGEYALVLLGARWPPALCSSNTFLDPEGSLTVSFPKAMRYPKNLWDYTMPIGYRVHQTDAMVTVSFTARPHEVFSKLSVELKQETDDFGDMVVFVIFLAHKTKTLGAGTWYKFCIKPGSGSADWVAPKAGMGVNTVLHRTSEIDFSDNMTSFNLSVRKAQEGLWSMVKVGHHPDALETILLAEGRIEQLKRAIARDLSKVEKGDLPLHLMKCTPLEATFALYDPPAVEEPEIEPQGPPVQAQDPAYTEVFGVHVTASDPHIAPKPVVGRTRAYSISVVEDFTCPVKGILKHRSVFRSVSECHAEEEGEESPSMCSMDSSSTIECPGTPSKKTVRFDEKVTRATFRPGSSILGQKRKNQRKQRSRRKRLTSSESCDSTNEVEEIMAAAVRNSSPPPHRVFFNLDLVKNESANSTDSEHEGVHETPPPTLPKILSRFSVSPVPPEEVTPVGEVGTPVDPPIEETPPKPEESPRPGEAPRKATKRRNRRRLKADMTSDDEEDHDVSHPLSIRIDNEQERVNSPVDGNLADGELSTSLECSPDTQLRDPTGNPSSAPPAIFPLEEDTDALRPDSEASLTDAQTDRGDAEETLGSAIFPLETETDATVSPAPADTQPDTDEMGHLSAGSPKDGLTTEGSRKDRFSSEDSAVNTDSGFESSTPTSLTPALPVN